MLVGLFIPGYGYYMKRKHEILTLRLCKMIYVFSFSVRKCRDSVAANMPRTGVAPAQGHLLAWFLSLQNLEEQTALWFQRLKQNFSLDPVVLYGCETCSLIVNVRVLRGTFGPKRKEVTGGWKTFHNEKRHDFYSSPNIVTMIISWGMILVGNVASMGGKRSAYTDLVGKH
jgi:hypothetical protein